tara:strand:- start:307 stop:1257 length:951 start_codon:yes stop_codon:yes gene_type:complete
MLKQEIVPLDYWKDYPKWQFFLDLGKRNLEIKENISAKNILTRSIEINQNNHLTFYYRGVANQRLLNYKEAIDDFTKSLAIKEYFKSYENIGIIYLSLKKYRNSVINISKAIKLKPNYSQLLYIRGWAYFYLEYWNKANIDFKNFIKRNPKDKNLLFCFEQLSLVNIKRKDFEEVKIYAKRGIELNKRRNWNIRGKHSDKKKERIKKNWLLFLGFANIKLKNYEEAEYWLDQVNFSYMDRPNTRACELLCRSFALSYLGKYDEALDYFDKALRVKKEFDWNFIFPEIRELLNELPIEMKNIIRIKFHYKFNKGRNH